MVQDPRLSQLSAIEAALKANVGGCQNAHPWIKPLWLEIQRLRAEANPKPSTEAPIKTATEILAERKKAEEEKKATKPRRGPKKKKDDEFKPE